MLKKIIVLPFLFSFTNNLYAMHISEGILPLNWALLWLGVSVPFLIYGARRLKRVAQTDLSIKPLVGLMAAVVFIISCMPVPVPIVGTCSHPCGTGIAAILLGPSISVLITGAALLIQAFFLAHGGISTWGADIVSMGVVGSFSGYCIFKTLRYFKVNLVISAFMGGIIADWATYAMTSIELASGIRGTQEFTPFFFQILVAFIPTQIPLGILEGFITSGMILMLYKKRPDILINLNVIEGTINGKNLP